MRHTAIGVALTGLAVFAASTGISRAQTVVRIPRIVNQKQAAVVPGNGGNATFAYVGTPTLRKQALDSYLAGIARKNPGRARMLASDFARNDADKLYQSLIANTGLQNYDAADALTAYNLTGWIIANGVKTLPPRAQILAARRQVAASLARNPGMVSAAERGKVGEQFKLLTVTLHFGLISARQSGDTKAYANQIAALFAETGPNPRTLALTNTGFVRKG